MKKGVPIFLCILCVLGIFLAGFEVRLVIYMITGVVPVQANRIIAMIAAAAFYIWLCILLYQYWKSEQ